LPSGVDDSQPMLRRKASAKATHHATHVGKRLLAEHLEQREAWRNNPDTIAVMNVMFMEEDEEGRIVLDSVEVHSDML